MKSIASHRTLAVLLLALPSALLLGLSCRIPPRGGGAQKPPPTGTWHPLLVRGYLALPTQRDADHRDIFASRQPGDIFLPGVLVFLREASSGETSRSVTTDLSGRFTLVAPKAGRYRLCWKSPNLGSGATRELISVGKGPVHVGTVHAVADRTVSNTVVHGEVRLADGSSPRTLEPLANINAFATVAALDKNGKAMSRAIVNNFGQFALPFSAPAKENVTLRASIEGAKADQLIRPEAGLFKAPMHDIDFRIANHAPRLEPIIALDGGGRRVKVAAPGDTVSLAAEALDKDGDPVKFTWLIGDGSGTLSAHDGPSTQWTLPNAAGRYTLTVFAYDGKGGYDRSAISLAADAGGIPFFGKVDATDAPAVVGAEVKVNGKKTVTGPGGYFQLNVPDARRFVLNIRKAGYGLMSRIYDDAVTSGLWTLTRASTARVDPRQNIDVVDRRDQRNCVGPLATRVDWQKGAFAGAVQFQDGKSNVVEPFVRLQELPPLDPRWRKPRDCGPGMRVVIPANALVDQDGHAPPGQVDVEVSTVDLLSPEQMPGDDSVRTPNGIRVMQSYGAGGVTVTASGKRYNLKPGASATIEIPVDPAQLAAGGPIPPTIPLLFYDESAGLWEPDGQATLNGNVYVAVVTHFSEINTDQLKQDQACVRVKSPDLPAAYKLEVYIPVGGGAAPVVKSKTMDNTAPSEHVIYNLPTSTNITLVPIDLSTQLPLGLFVVNTGGAQNPTDPNLPEGPPYDACSTEVTLTALTVPEAEGEFLHGISYEAVNLDEEDAAAPFDPGDPGGPTVAEFFDQATANYYERIDPLHLRTTLAGFKNVNGFTDEDTTNPDEIKLIYANSGDLGFGREMHGVRDGSRVAAYVTNYGDITTKDVITAEDDDADVFNAAIGHLPGATVAMEYAPIEDAPGDPADCDETLPIMKFFVYVNGNVARAANLDGYGARPVPQLCMICHGGAYPGGDVPDDDTPFTSCSEVNLGSKFLPFDLSYYTFTPDGTPFDKSSQQADFKRFNEELVRFAPPEPALPIAEIIQKMYNPPNATDPDFQNDDFVADGWNASNLERTTYAQVIGEACRTCHAANPFPELWFNAASQLTSGAGRGRLGSVEGRVCADHVMPHAKITHTLFWTFTQDPLNYMPALLQAFGDTVGSAGNGWQGNVCGEFTPGGQTPQSEYAEVIQPILSSRCASCHNGSAAPPECKPMSLGVGSSYAAIVGVPAGEAPALQRVAPGDHANSYLWQKITNSAAATNSACDPDCCSKMPPGSSLNQAQIDAIAAWIDAGAEGP